MPTYLHRTDKTLLTSVAEADLAEAVANYILEPDLSAVTGQPVKYWEISGDTVSLADQSTRDAIDAAELSDSYDSIADEMDVLESITRAAMLVVLDEVNVLRAQHGLADRTAVQFKTAIRNKLGN